MEQTKHNKLRSFSPPQHMSAFHDAVYSAIQEIPRGRVTTYGHIAALIGTRTSRPLHASVACSFVAGIPHAVRKLTRTAERPRQVGICLKHLPSDPEAEFNNQTVPWQRVINAKGAISPR